MHDARHPRPPAVGFGPPLVLIQGTPTTVAANLAARVAERPHGIIRSYGLGGAGRPQSYADTWYRSSSMLAGMRESGIRSGEIVVLLIDDVIDFVPAYWACIRGGFVPAPLMSVAHQRSSNSLLEALNRLNDATIVVDESFAAIAATVGREEGLRVLPLRIVEAQAGADDYDASPADPLCLVPSSGSTGRLKLVALSHSSVLQRSFADPFRKQASHLGTVALDSISAAQNGIFLSYGSWIQMSPLALTARPTSVLDAIERHHITVAGCLPSAVKTIVAAAQGTDRKWNLGSLERFALGAEPIAPKVMQILGDFLDRSGPSRRIITAGYGTTETGFLVTGAHPFADPGGGDDAVSLGTSAPGVELRIVGDDDEVLAEGDIGQVQVNCPRRIFSCYWGEPEATRNSFTDDGWWRTGDLGRLQQGELSLHGRAKEVLVVSGKKFSLAEIDAEIETVLSVGDRAFCCAVRRPEEASERLAVVVVAAEATNSRDQLFEKIGAAVGRRYGLNVDPVIEASLDDVPFAANGKLRRSELANRICRGSLTPAQQITQTLPASPSIKPRTIFEIEERLAQIWREVLDVHGNLDKQANFFDLGGDSLRSLMLYTSIETQFGQQISAERFFASPTFAHLLRLVAEGGAISALGPEPSHLTVPWPLPNDVRNKLLVHFESWNGSRPTRDRVVAGLNLAGNKIPLFWVFQEASEFHKVASVLGPNQPMYAFRSGLGVIKYREDEVQSFALRYVSEIEEVCPHGPVFIGGTCQGAIIAQAMAQHLLRRRRHVPLLMLMEWGFPLQSYAGPVLLIHARDSIQCNPFLRYGNPGAVFAKVFPDYDIAEMPGDHDHTFDDANVAVLGEIVKANIHRAENALLRPIRNSEYRAQINAEGIPRATDQGLLRAKLAAARQRIAYLEKDLIAYQTSTSWRVTRPLRLIKKAIRMMFRSPRSFMRRALHIIVKPEAR